jgi:hypothetical protein
MEGVMAKTVLRFISDPGHGWVEVPVDLLEKLRLGTDFPRRGDMCYLEEDGEASQLDDAIKRSKREVTYADAEVYSFDEWLAGDDWPYIPARIYEDDIELVVYALRSEAERSAGKSIDCTYSATEREAFADERKSLERLALMFSVMRGVDK